jgi:fructosamine-3-kinase
MSDSSIKVESRFGECDILAAIECATGESAISALPLHGGMISDVRKVTFADGRVAVSKYWEGPDAHFDIEARMIECLRRPDVVPVPRVYFASKELLIQEFMPGSHLTAEAEAHAGETLARLHRIRGDAFGFEGATLNGWFEMPNGWWERWIPCFRDTRLGHCADAAVANGTLPAGLRARIEVLRERLGDLLVEPEYPTLIHGDVWSANVLATEGRVTALIDPSTHFGHPELDIANAVLIGGFGDRFTRAYLRHHPLDDGFWNSRMYVYATYSAIMHVFYFGQRYEPLLDRMLAKLGV